MLKLFLVFCCCAFLAVEAIPEKEATAAANALLEVAMALQQQAAADCQASNGGQPCRRRAFDLHPTIVRSGYPDFGI